MKKSYHKRRNSGGLHIFTILGIGCAFVFAIGVMKQSGIRLVYEKPQKVSEERVATASIATTVTPAISEETAEEIVVITAPTPVEPPKAVVPSPSTSAAAPMSNLDIEVWINQFDEAATIQALEQGVPAGIALAYGIVQINKGVTINNWQAFSSKVIEPLAALKANAASDDRSKYFKYSANSSLWAEGLGANQKADTKTLKTLLHHHKLEHYDNEVKRRLKGAVNHNPAVEQQAEAVAKKVTTAQANKLAAAKQNTSKPEKVAQSKSDYDAAVGKTVAKSIAREKLNSGRYITKADMERLLEETNQETEEVLKNKTMFMGRKINENHPQAGTMMDKSNPKNAQARGEYYQERLKAKKITANQ